MKEGKVVLAALPQSDGRQKKRPALLLRIMPGYGDCLVCGVSSQLKQTVQGFDEVITETDADFVDSGLTTGSVIRLGFLAVWPRSTILGVIGHIEMQRYRRLIHRLAMYLDDLEAGRFPL